MKEQDFIDLGLYPDKIRTWENRMCFNNYGYKRTKNPIVLEYHIPSKVLIIKQPYKKTKILSRFKILFNGIVEDKIKLKEIIDENSRITNRNK